MGNLFSEVSCSLQSERAASAFYCLAPVARTVGHFTPSFEAKGDSSEGVPIALLF